VALTKALLPHIISKQIGHFEVVQLLSRENLELNSIKLCWHPSMHFMASLRPWAGRALQRSNHVTRFALDLFHDQRISVNACTADACTPNERIKAQATAWVLKNVRKKSFASIKFKKEEVYIGEKKLTGVFKRFFPTVFSLNSPESQTFR